MSVEDQQKWDERWGAVASDPTWVGPGDPVPFFQRAATWLPAGGSALDVAGGAGTHAFWLVRRGLRATLVDVSPRALALATRSAVRSGVRLDVVRADLETDPLPSGPWDVITVSMYLQRSLLPTLVEALAPGGLLLMSHATTTNLERNARPSRHFLLEPGELPTLLPGLDILMYEEDWTPDGRHLANVAGRRAAA